MEIEIWSDVACPFCYIGKRRFEKAIEQLPFQNELTVVWRSYQLSPDIVTRPNYSITDYLVEQKGMRAEEAVEMNNYVQQMAEAENLSFDFAKLKVANTFKAHKLIQLSKQFSLQNEVEELLFRAYFSEGKNISDDEELIRIAEAAGIGREPAATALASEALNAAVEADIYEAFQIGIHSVPFFVVNRKYGIAGAQPPNVFIDTLQKAHKEASEA